MMNRAAIVTLALLAGCANDIDSDYDFSSGGNGAETGAMDGDGTAGGDDAPGDAGGDAAEGTGAASAGAESGDGADGSDETTGGVLEGSPCNGVDLVFVVDNSSTMTEEQNRLISVASTWVANVSSATATEGGVRVGVVATDSQGFRTTDRDGEQCGQLTASEFWMTPSSPEFNTTLACTLNQGTAGGADQRQIESLMATLGGGEGESFLRPDALLVVVVVSDEDDDAKEGNIGSAGEPGDWVEQLEGIKGYRQNAAIVTLVGHEAPNACPPYQWDGSTGAEIAERILQFGGAFPTHEVGDICALTYGSFFGSTVDPIADACENIVF